ncbi:cysteine--tRNA ligase [Candidatus Cyanaurora vandensis]|uniref:cysteine--tRNA ligase n=1 Tax=Candidatus Cyanaurora vandensis TaxID=2714958 RepID=UPI00258082DC|nr:cysteine--tRNA ligase [Candidatus Cyanaurora vandensis]
MLSFYNTLSRRKEPFVPRVPGQVSVYVCGVTVYDRCHIGHGRAFVVWDTLRRYLVWRGFQVQYVQNFTDIDDKIIRRAQEEGRDWQAVVEDNIRAYFADMALLNIQPADLYPRATESLGEIELFIETLLGQGLAYRSQGDVYYAVRKFPDYGKLSGKRLADLAVGASERMQAEEIERKQDPLDFALWKAAKPGEPFWVTGFSEGRPGWHIECSAMIQKHLGATIDIHAGGEDLVFPHHENEIAQSEAVHGVPLANFWMHNAFITVNGEKMSKSLGNFITIADAATRYDPLALRLLTLQSHYRTAIDFTDDSLKSAQIAWERVEQVVRFGEELNLDRAGDLDAASLDRFTQAMDNDLNTPQGLAVVFELVKDLLPERNVHRHGGALTVPLDQLANSWRTLLNLLAPLGLIPSAPPQPKAQALTASVIEEQIAQRRTAKNARDFSTADRIRAELLTQGVVLVDNPDKTTHWHWQD